MPRYKVRAWYSVYRDMYVEAASPREAQQAAAEAADNLSVAHLVLAHRTVELIEATVQREVEL